MRHQNVNSVFKVNNKFDFQLEVVVKHIKDMEDFLEKVESKFRLKDVEVHYIIEDLKREGFLDDPETINLIE